MATIRMWAGDYTLSGLLGFELHAKTVGVLGTGAIGAVACRIFMVGAAHGTLSWAPMLHAPRTWVRPAGPASGASGVQTRGRMKHFSAGVVDGQQVLSGVWHALELVGGGGTLSALFPRDSAQALVICLFCGASAVKCWRMTSARARVAEVPSSALHK